MRRIVNAAHSTFSINSLYTRISVWNSPYMWKRKYFMCHFLNLVVASLGVHKIFLCCLHQFDSSMFWAFSQDRNIRLSIIKLRKVGKCHSSSVRPFSQISSIILTGLATILRFFMAEPCWGLAYLINRCTLIWSEIRKDVIIKIGICKTRSRG